MAAPHIAIASTDHGAQLKAYRNALKLVITEGPLLLAKMALMIDGDGSSAEHFSYMQEKFGFADDAGAKAAYDELSSVLFKLGTNGSVTDVNAAVLQVFNKFR